MVSEVRRLSGCDAERVLGLRCCLGRYGHTVGLTLAQLEAQKRGFLAVFGWRRAGVPAQQVALDDARTAASRRARLYRPGTTRAERYEVRQVWAEKLRELAAPYLDAGRGDGRVARSHFEDDLMALRGI